MKLLLSIAIIALVGCKAKPAEKGAVIFQGREAEVEPIAWAGEPVTRIDTPTILNGNPYAKYLKSTKYCVDEFSNSFKGVNEFILRPSLGDGVDTLSQNGSNIYILGSSHHGSYDPHTGATENWETYWFVKDVSMGRDWNNQLPDKSIRFYLNQKDELVAIWFIDGNRTKIYYK